MFKGLSRDQLYLLGRELVLVHPTPFQERVALVVAVLGLSSALALLVNWFLWHSSVLGWLAVVGLWVNFVYLLIRRRPRRLTSRELSALKGSPRVLVVSAEAVGREEPARKGRLIPFRFHHEQGSLELYFSPEQVEKIRRSLSGASP